MHPQIIFDISRDRHREDLARAERWRLARSAGTSSGGSYPRSPLTRLASWARGVTGRRAGWAAMAQPAPGPVRAGERVPQGPGQPEPVPSAADAAGSRVPGSRRAGLAVSATTSIRVHDQDL